MKVPSFEQLAPAYTKLWEELEPLPSAQGEIATAVKRVLRCKPVYQNVSSRIWGTPDNWPVIALIDEREGGGGAKTHLYNGDSLKARTVNVPAGEPAPGQCDGPPFSFEDSAYWAVRHDGLNVVTDWTPAAYGYYNEKYNGWGYINKDEEDPYLVGQSNKETAGKYIKDGKFDPKEFDKQIGVLTLLKALVAADPTIKLGSYAMSATETVTSQTVHTTQVTQPVTVTRPAPTIDVKQIVDEIELVLKFAPFIEALVPSIKPALDIVKKIADVIETQVK